MKLVLEIIFDIIKYFGSGIAALIYHKKIINELKAATSKLVLKINSVESIAKQEKEKMLLELKDELNKVKSKF